MRKFITKFRYWLALLVIVLTISNVTVPTNQLNPSDSMQTLGNGAAWGFETH